MTDPGEKSRHTKEDTMYIVLAVYNVFLFCFVLFGALQTFERPIWTSVERSCTTDESPAELNFPIRAEGAKNKIHKLALTDFLLA